MEQDLRKLFEKEREKKYRLKEGHEARFMKRLDRELPPEKRNSRVWIFSIAATVLVLVSVGAFWLTTQQNPIPSENTVADTEQQTMEGTISLGDLSPDLEKVENYYLASINLELSRLEVSSDNKELVDSYMEQLAELNREYDQLNKELNTFGPNDQTISALIKNLQLRLELLKKLKEKLNQIKSSKNEQLSSNQV
jgi:flagellar basal body-associated protein FliL